MSMEAVMFESTTYRQRLSGRTEVLDKVKVLALLPDGVHVTTRMVADYFEVTDEMIRRLVSRHRAEFLENGLVILKGADLQEYQRDNLSLSSGGFPQRRSSLRLFSRRAVLNVAMLLRESEVAREVRRWLLDVEARGGGVYFDYDALVAELERRLLAGRVGERLGRCEGMLLADRGLVRAMSVRLCEVGEDVRALRADMGELRRGLGRLGVVGRGRWW